jgi:hypothetical protein
MSHPLILKYEQSDQLNFPLILVIGREPNTNDVSDGLVGNYDFDKYPKCAFWNVAFSLLARIIESTRKEIKEKFRKQQAAPLLFSDAFAQGIENRVNNKLSIRTEQVLAANDQVEAIFKHSYLLNRVKLIILSGLERKVYDNFKSKIHIRLQQSGVIIIELPFFYPTNMPSIMKCLTEENRILIKEIYKAYINESKLMPQSPSLPRDAPPGA